jgi:hypothetical protein
MFYKCHPIVLLIAQKLNQYLSKYNKILPIIQNYMFWPIFGNPQVHKGLLKHVRMKCTVHKSVIILIESYVLTKCTDIMYISSSVCFKEQF